MSFCAYVAVCEGTINEQQESYGLEKHVLEKYVSWKYLGFRIKYYEWHVTVIFVCCMYTFWYFSLWAIYVNLIRLTFTKTKIDWIFYISIVQSSTNLATCKTGPTRFVLSETYDRILDKMKIYELENSVVHLRKEKNEVQEAFFNRNVNLGAEVRIS